MVLGILVPRFNSLSPQYCAPTLPVLLAATLDLPDYPHRLPAPSSWSCPVYPPLSCCTALILATRSTFFFFSQGEYFLSRMWVPEGKDPSAPVRHRSSDANSQICGMCACWSQLVKPSHSAGSVGTRPSHHSAWSLGVQCWATQLFESLFLGSLKHPLQGSLRLPYPQGFPSPMIRERSSNFLFSITLLSVASPRTLYWNVLELCPASILNWPAQMCLLLFSFYEKKERIFSCFWVWVQSHSSPWCGRVLCVDRLDASTCLIIFMYHGYFQCQHCHLPSSI